MRGELGAAGGGVWAHSRRRCFVSLKRLFYEFVGKYVFMNLLIDVDVVGRVPCCCCKNVKQEKEKEMLREPCVRDV